MRENGNVAVIVMAVLLLMAAVGIGAYLLGSGKLSVSLNMGGQSPKPSPSVYQYSTPTFTPFSIEPMSGWKTYNDKDGKYSFKYPPEVTLKEYEGGTVSVYLWGPTQKEGTEFYDGINLSFKKGAVGGPASLRAAAEKKASELKGVFETTDVSEVIIAGISGYKFHVKGYIEGDYYYLPLGSGIYEPIQYLEIIDSTKDPTNKGFAQTTVQILSTLKIK